MSNQAPPRVGPERVANGSHARPDVLTEAGTSFAWFSQVFLAQGYIVGRLHRHFTRTAVLEWLAAGHHGAGL